MSFPGAGQGPRRVDFRPKIPKWETLCVQPSEKRPGRAPRQGRGKRNCRSACSWPRVPHALQAQRQPRQGQRASPRCSLRLDRGPNRSRNTARTAADAASPRLAT
eukprot:scaffold549_cov385-Prasinococcus_capsulatus_cf.AAC.47